MNLFVKEIKDHKKSLLIWCIGMIFMVAGGMGKYSGYASSVGSMNKLVAQMPKALQAMMGFNNFDLAKASGFYGMLFPFLVLMASVHASMLGVHIISKEERDKTAEFLFAKPISRSKVITSKVFAGLINIIILNGVTTTISLFLVSYLNREVAEEGYILLLMFGMFMLQLLFMFVGLGTAAISKTAKRASIITSSIVLITFILSKVSDLSSQLAILNYITPFKYYDANEVMRNQRVGVISIVLTLILVIVIAWVMYWGYNKRDLSL